MTNSGEGSSEGPTLPELRAASNELGQVIERRKLLDALHEAVPDTPENANLRAAIDLAFEAFVERHTGDVEKMRALVERVEREEESDAVSGVAPEEARSAEQVAVPEGRRRGVPRLPESEIAAREQWIREQFGGQSELLLRRLRKTTHNYLPIPTMVAALAETERHFSAETARELIVRSPTVLSIESGTIGRFIEVYQHAGIPNPLVLMRRHAGLITTNPDAATNRFRSLSKLLRLFNLTSETEATSRAIDLTSDFPQLLTFGLQRLFIAIRILRHLNVPAPNVELKHLRPLLIHRPGDLVNALNELPTGVTGASALQELFRYLNAKKTRREMPVDPAALMRSQVQHIEAAHADMPREDIPDSVLQLMTLLYRTIAYDEKFSRKRSQAE